MHNQLKKAIALAKKTGDRLIIFDALHTDNPYVLMSMEEYEKLVVEKSEVRDLTEDELLDKINRDIAIWKSEQELENIAKIDEFGPGLSDPAITEPIAIKDIITNIKPKTKKRWTISEDIKDGAEEVIEEDRQYLEDVDF